MMCDTCKFDPSHRLGLNKKNPEDVKLAQAHVLRHEGFYLNHKMKIIWCKSCGELHKYEVILIHTEKIR